MNNDAPKTKITFLKNSMTLLQTKIVLDPDNLYYALKKPRLRRAPNKLNYALKNQDYALNKLNYAPKNQDYALIKDISGNWIAELPAFYV